jgi:hypothetical protein
LAFEKTHIPIPPNYSETRQEWKDWFSSIWRFVSKYDSTENPHNTSIDQVYAAGSDNYITNRDPSRYALLGA